MLKSTIRRGVDSYLETNTLYRLSQDAEVNYPTLSQFHKSGRAMSLDNASKLYDFLVESGHLVHDDQPAPELPPISHIMMAARGIVIATRNDERLPRSKHEIAMKKSIRDLMRTIRRKRLTPDQLSWCISQ